MAKYLTQDGVQLIINDYNGKLDLKASKAELASYATKQDLANIDFPDIPQTDLTNYATKAELQTAIASIEEYDDTALAARVTTLEGGLQGVYHYKGSVADLDALQAIQNPANGDVYNIEDTGMNAAWDGQKWDDFGTIVDLSEYVKASEVQALTTAEVNAILFSGKTAVVSNAESFQAVLSNNQPAVEITVNDDVTLTSSLVVPAGKKVTLNLGDNTIESGATQAFVANGATSELILNGGTISSDSNGTVYANDGGKVTINGTTIISTNDNCVCSRGDGSQVIVNSGELTGQEYGILAIDAGDVVINGGTIKGIDNFAIGGNGTSGRGGCDVTINGGTFEGHITSPGYMATAIYWPNEGTLTINGGTIITDGAGIVQRGGIVNIGADVVIQASDNPVDFETGKAGDSRNVVGRYGIVYDYNSKYPAYETMQLNIAAGAQISGIDGDLQVLPADAPGITDNRTPVGE